MFGKSRQNPTSAVKHRLAFKLMHLIFIGVPLFAGIDKYFNFITEWERYVSPTLKPFIPLSTKQIMHVAGVAEIAVGMTAAAKPRVGSILFAMMMGGIVLNLLTMKKQLHIASLDTCLAAFALVHALLRPEAEKAE